MGHQLQLLPASNFTSLYPAILFTLQFVAPTHFQFGCAVSSLAMTNWLLQDNLLQENLRYFYEKECNILGLCRIPYLLDTTKSLGYQSGIGVPRNNVGNAKH